MDGKHDQAGGGRAQDTPPALPHGGVVRVRSAEAGGRGPPGVGSQDLAVPRPRQRRLRPRAAQRHHKLERGLPQGRRRGRDRLNDFFFFYLVQNFLVNFFYGMNA